MRRVEGLTRLGQVRNEEIRQRLNQEAVVDTMRRRQRMWKERIESRVKADWQEEEFMRMR